MDITRWFDYGVAVVAIAALVYVVRIFVCFIKNHMSDATKASQRLADMIEQMLAFLRGR